MNIVVKNIDCKGETFTLTNQRAIYWNKESALILSDLHVGKSATFRKHGIPISKRVLEDDLDRLSQLISHFDVDILIVVGDLFHAEFNKDIAYFKDWFQASAIEIELIVGNHDRYSHRFYEELNFRVYAKERISDAIRFVHDETRPSERYFTISGHTHPGVLIKGKGRQTMKLPCYQVTKDQLILPAFSKFTGLNTRNLPKDCSCYAFTESSIVKI
jgi:DNA ligase-associated metallophosphoesterase